MDRHRSEPRRVALLNDPDNVLWDGTALRETSSIPAPRNLLQRAGFEILRGAPPGEVVAGVVLVADDDALEEAALSWSLALARRRGFDRVVVLLWPSAEDVSRDDLHAHLRDAGFDPESCPIVEATVEEHGDPEWGTQFDVMDVPSARQLVAALREAATDGPPPALAEGGPVDALLGVIEAFGTASVTLPVARGQLTPAAAWRYVELGAGRIGRTLVDAEPYIEEADGGWPACPRCRQAMSTVFQVDPSDGAHADRFGGLYVAFACCADDEPSTTIRYYAEPRTARRVKLPLPLTDRPGGRLGYLLERGAPLLLHRPWSALPAPARRAFDAGLDGTAGEELYERLTGLVGGPSADASSGGGFTPPTCDRCGDACSLLFSTTYLAGLEHVYELWACACAPDRARLALRPVESTAPAHLP
ncbi:MAG: hypothetical protein KF894_25225 [Labilithrix sp.]|nr:hypothetical protein [Labilithrix sp.]